MSSVFTATLDSNNLPGVGYGSITLNGNTLFWSLDWSGISSPVNSVNFYGKDMTAQLNIGSNSNQNIPYISPLVGKGSLLIGGNQELI